MRGERSRDRDRFPDRSQLRDRDRFLLDERCLALVRVLRPLEPTAAASSFSESLLRTSRFTDVNVDVVVVVTATTTGVSSVFVDGFTDPLIVSDKFGNVDTGIIGLISFTFMSESGFGEPPTRSTSRFNVLALGTAATFGFGGFVFGITWLLFR